MPQGLPIGKSKGRDTYLPPETTYTRKTNPFPMGGGFVDESGTVPRPRKRSAARRWVPRPTTRKGGR